MSDPSSRIVQWLGFALFRLSNGNKSHLELRPQPLEARRLGVGCPSVGRFLAFYYKIKLFLGIFKL